LFEATERALARYRERRERRDQMRAIQALVSSLTAREREVFSLVVRGKLNKQIAFELGASERTIKAHRHAVMGKLKARSLAEVVSIAERLGMLAAAESAKPASPPPDRGSHD
jgi:FixJ family two-component response regulator